MTTIHIHEDDWGMRNLYPVAGFPEAAKDVGKAIANSEANALMRVTEMHLISEPATNWPSLGISPAEFRQLLEPILPRVARFNATISSAMYSNKRDPYGSYEEDALAFGFNADRFIKIESKDGIIAAVWYQLPWGLGADIEPILAGINAIHARWPICIADYYLDVAVDLSASGAIDRYVSEYTAACEEAARRYEAYRKAESEKRATPAASVPRHLESRSKLAKLVEKFRQIGFFKDHRDSGR